MPSNVKVLVITGFGLNCEAETSYAFTLAGAEAEQVHLNDLLDGRRSLDEFHILALIGGFSFGDHIGGGKVFANRMKYRLGEPLQKFVADGKLVIGICNGFQTMVKLGMLPALDGDYQRQTVTLTNNDSGVFHDGWIHLSVNPKSPCVFTRGIERLYLPVRHGEGKLVTLDESVLKRMGAGNQVVAQYTDPVTGAPTQEYPHNPNGSALAIAAMCDPRGRILGIMPHPEAYLSPYNHPQWFRQQMADELPEHGQGLAIFRNAVEFAREELV
jgi:phosphoribosylformylglycinamidine synthase